MKARFAFIGCSIVLGATLSGFGAGALAQGASAAGLERLSVFEGTWTVHSDPAPLAASPNAVVTPQWVLGKRWLHMQLGPDAPGAYSVAVYLTWDAQAGKYRAAALNSLSPVPLTYVGEWDSPTRLVFTATVRPAVIQRVTYELQADGTIGFSSENSFDGGASFALHARARWQR